MDKHQLRKWAKEIRSKLDMKALSKELVKNLRQTEEYKNSKKIMIFYPLKGEVDLLELMNDDTKTFYLPKINGDTLLCCKYDKDTELCESCFHTMEPVVSPSPLKGEELELAPPNEYIYTPEGHNSSFTFPDLVIVPALAVDKNNYRLGYGGGFYDRYLGQFSKENRPKTIVCIPKMLITETIFHNEHDIKIDKIITA